ncbi:MAG: exosortase/archaeosortase family protein, partial [Anaerolineae bacterium]|nr:exosortase/archaeosortase family protein [Anaerolineae bacterium]
MTKKPKQAESPANIANSHWVMLVIGIGFIILTWPVWRWLWGEWMANDYYSHGILIAPVAFYLAWRRLRNQETRIWETDNRDLWALLAVAASLAALLYFLNDKAYYLAAFAMVGLLTSLVWTFAGRRTLWLLAFPLAYLLL